MRRLLEDRESALSLQCAEVRRLRDDLESMQTEGFITGVSVGVGLSVESSYSSASSASVGFACVSDSPWLVHQRCLSA